MDAALPGNAGGAGAEGTAQALGPAARERLADPIAEAFAHTYWWSMALIAIAIVPALFLWREQRRYGPAGRREFGPALPADAELAQGDDRRPVPEPVGG